MFFFANLVLVQVRGGGVKKLVIFCRYHNCMIPNVKRVMFLALVLVLQWNSHPQFLVQLCSKWKAYNLKHFQLSRMAPKCAIANLYSSKNYCGKKPKNLPHMFRGHFIKVFYKMATCPRWPILGGLKNGSLI